MLYTIHQGPLTFASHIMVRFALFAALLLVATVALAQPNPPTPPPPVPIDGGLGLLALAGAGFAAKKLRQKKNS